MFPKILVIAFGLGAVSIAVCSESSGWIVRPNGIGPVKIGMTMAQADAVLHESFPQPKDEDERGCYYVYPKLHQYVAFMVQQQRIVRLDILDGGVTPTSAGVRIGDPVEKVMKIYGSKIEIEPNYYDDQEKYLTVHSADRRYAVRFETDRGNIAHIYAGRSSAVSLVEGCQ